MLSEQLFCKPETRLLEELGRLLDLVPDRGSLTIVVQPLIAIHPAGSSPGLKIQALCDGEILGSVLLFSGDDSNDKLGTIETLRTTVERKMPLIEREELT